jgi:hypothetical protein
MPTILELFKESPQDKAVNSAANESKGGFKQDVTNFVQQELNGIRKASLVDINNPLIYGNQAVRIAQRTTPDKEDMTAGIVEGATGGLGLNKVIGKARDAVNSVLGIPETTLPSRVIKLDGSNKGSITFSENLSSEPITLASYGKNGTELGKLLKQSGGNPSTIAKQAVGGALGMAKDKLRGALFGSPGTIGDAIGDNNSKNLEYHNDNTYSQVLKDTSKAFSRNMFDEGGEMSADTHLPFANKSKTELDFSLVSPIYGLDRTSSDGMFGSNPNKLSNAFSYKVGKDVVKNVPGYYPDKKFTDNERFKEGWDDISKIFGGTSLADSNGKYIDAGGTEVEKSKMEQYDIIPFWISGLDASKAIFFKCIISGLSETSTPSWSGNKFVGNPYNYYTYDGVERALTFSFDIYCTNQGELTNNWEKITALTKKTYPTIVNGISNPPFIMFRLGDLYNGKIGFIESLTYTFPDNGTWETQTSGILLPKFINASLTIKFVEMPGSELSLYSYEKSDEAIEEIKEKTSPSGDGANEQSQTGDGAQVKVTVNAKTGETTSTPEKEEGGSGTQNLDGGAEKTPEQLKEEAIAAYKSKRAATIKKRLEEVKAKGIDPNLIGLGKAIAQDFEIEISSIKKEKENAYSYMRNYTFYGKPRQQKMVGFDIGPNGSRSISYEYWPGKSKADENYENSEYSDIFG